MGRALLLVLAAAPVSGCEGLATQQKADQLSRVAKDWCLTIRASRVIPVYPLTEDVQPGDVFLVARSIQDEEKQYEQKGFLPLQNMVARLQPSGEVYNKFYSGRYLITADKEHTPPGTWQFPGNSDPKNPSTQPSYNFAPRAAFPSYTFQVRNGESLNLAVPIHSVPVALALLNTAQATGEVQLSDAYTYGLDLPEIRGLLEDWRKNHGGQQVIENAISVQSALREEAKGRGLFYNLMNWRLGQKYGSAYLRVVTRVYLVGGVDVALSSGASGGFGVKAGVDTPIDISKLGSMSTTQPTTQPTGNRVDDAYQSIGDAVTKSIASASPGQVGGAVSLLAASSRTVGMRGAFARPLVVGYLGFDLEIYYDEKTKQTTLSEPYPTLVRLVTMAEQLTTPTKPSK